MIRNILLGTAAALIVSGSAFASDLPSRKAPAYAPVPTFTWTGFYVGGSAGYLGTNTKLSNAASGTLNQGAGIFGVDVGYNYQVQQYVFGLEADISALTSEKKTGIYNTYTASERQTALGTVRGRVGYAYDRALFYVTGGLAYATLKNSFVDNTLAGYSNSKTAYGYTLGAGVEYALTNNWTVRAEGLYVDLGKSNVSGGGNTIGFRGQDYIGRVGVNYKF